MTEPLLLKPSIQSYGWGDPHAIPEALGLAPTGEPFAEAWYGAHAHAPAIAQVHGIERPLDQEIARRPEMLLGARVHAQFGELPYLLKLLTAAKPLSIQVHPSRSQAEAGFAREQQAGIKPDAPARSYRDPNHKLELLVALTGFDALCGFRSPDQITTVLQTIPEVAALLLPYQPTTASLRALLDAYFALPAAELEAALRRMLARFAAQDQLSAYTPRDAEYWALRSHRAMSLDVPDRGLLFVFLLDRVHLEPGQGLFIAAGVPHSYLGGAGIELMSASDNVLRAGLTPKHVDPEELLRVVRFDARAPSVISAVFDERHAVAEYPVAAEEFALSRFDLDPAVPVTRVACGPETLLASPDATSSTITIVCGGKPLQLSRGHACLVPDGVRYTLESSCPTRLFRVHVPGGEPNEDFRGARPAKLSFGTSGLRGLVSDLTDLETYINTRGYLDFLVTTGAAVPGTTIAIAGDLRPSTDGAERSISRAVALAIRDSGMQIVNCGRIPTPALTYFGIRNDWPSIMVTGSHIPFDRNGIKFNKPNGEVLKSDEAPILAAVARVRGVEYRRARAGSHFDDNGWFLSGRGTPLPDAGDCARQLYVRRYLDVFPADALAGMRVAVYEHSAVGRELLSEILSGLGAGVCPVGRADGFVAIDTEAMSEQQLGEIQVLADEVRTRMGPIDALVSTDGDSDRPLVVGVDRDGRAHFLAGDLLGIIVAAALRADAIAVPVSATDAIDMHFDPGDVKIARTRIGSPWVIAAMLSLEGERRVGWEANGGFMTGSTIAMDTGTLEALPTRDAVLPILVALHAARMSKCSLLDLFAALPRRFGRSGVLDDVPFEVSRALLEHFGPGDPSVRSVRFADDRLQWTDLSGREHDRDGVRARRLRDTRDALASHFGAQRGLDSLNEMDFLDGIRMTFAGGDIVHVRPSGNAPQLRVYTFANSEDRADQIASSMLAEPNGVLRELLRATGALDQV